MIKIDPCPLRGITQQYSWGKEVEHSIISRFRNIQANIPTSGIIAEFWIGSHKNGESDVLYNNQWQSLSSILDKVLNTELKFLAKILSINKPLSIQLHPNEDEAKILHKQNPSIFPDSSSKPEMAIALTDLSLLCGVRPDQEIKEELLNNPLLSHLDLNISEIYQNSGVKGLLKSILSLSTEQISNLIVKISPSTVIRNEHDFLALELIFKEKISDPGLLAIYFLNYVHVKKGSAIYIEPKIPHAYISGEAFECMKNSDNVVRGGLTPKPIDVENFCNLIECKYYDPTFKHTNNDLIKVYDHQDLPFTVEHILTLDACNINLSDKSQIEFLLCVNGNGQIKSNNNTYQLEAGSCYLSLNSSQTLSLAAGSQIFRVKSK